MRKVIAAILLVVYLSLLLNLTLFLDTGSIPPPEERLNLVPLRTIVFYLREGGWPMIVNVLGNLAAFAPLGFLVPLLRDSLSGPLRISQLSMMLSLLIETLQYLSRSRIADVDDVILNTLGGLLGYGLWAMMRLSVRRIV